mmetsp:Transcript_88/g.152  ORF Transcript_88/g.152 Transcript_88/m.152 type:complete len:98 (+) Transcript_88:24-317(+)
MGVESSKSRGPVEDLIRSKDAPSPMSLPVNTVVVFDDPVVASYLVKSVYEERHSYVPLLSSRGPRQTDVHRAWIVSCHVDVECSIAFVEYQVGELWS